MSPVGGSTRWCPTPEQLMILEEMYTGGVKTPTATQIQQITAHLSRYGKIEGKNVFYWFQNHKARDRQKLRRRLAKHLLMMSGSNFHQYPPHHHNHSFDRHPQLVSTGGYNHTHYHNHHLSLIPPLSCCQSQLPAPPPHDHFLSPPICTAACNFIPTHNLGSTNVNAMGSPTTTAAAAAANSTCASGNSPVMVRCNQQQLACNYNIYPTSAANSFVKYYSEARAQQQGPVSSSPDHPSKGYDTMKLERVDDDQGTTMMKKGKPPVALLKTDDDHDHDWMMAIRHEDNHHSAVAGGVGPLKTLQLFPITPVKD